MIDEELFEKLESAGDPGAAQDRGPHASLCKACGVGYKYRVHRSFLEKLFRISKKYECSSCGDISYVRR